MVCKEFYGVDVALGTFSLDLFLTFSWSDPSAPSLLEDHKDSAILPVDTPLYKLWVPATVITSRAAKGIETISEFLEVSREGNGTVKHVQRLIYVGKAKYALMDFPFDTQTLSVLVSSANQNFDEVVLVPADNATANGISPTAFNDKPFYVRGSNQTSIKEVFGPLQRSVGKFDIVVTRKAMAPFRKAAYPQILLLFTAFSVFFLPLAPWAMMPRVATCLIAFLALMGLHSSQGLPPAASISFMDLLNGAVMQLIITALILNVFIHYITFVYKDEELAQEVNHDLRLYWSAVAIISLFLCALGAGSAFLNLGFGLRELAIATLVGIWSFNLGYIYYIKRRHDERVRAKAGQP